VTLQAQVTGTLTRFDIPEGAVVKAGQTVAQIDPVAYEADVKHAQGDLDTAKAKLANAQVTLTRQQQLFKSKTIDLADLQDAEADVLAAQGDVLTAEGELADAQINLGYCTITSPINGKTGLYLVDAGNLVTANSTQIVNIQTIDPIYVDFTISENDFARVRNYFHSGSLPVRATLPGDAGDPITGELTFINNSIASSTGTLTLRAQFPNPDARLWPGLFVNVELILTTLDKAIVVPSASVLVGQSGPYLFVIESNNTVSMRNVEITETLGDETVLAKGVAAGERVVTAGQLGLAPGKAVTPIPPTAPSPE
jgi:multidrug efflux system membrane fusion protein